MYLLSDVKKQSAQLDKHLQGIKELWHLCEGPIHGYITWRIERKTSVDQYFFSL